jgi:ribosome-associated protein
MAALRDLHPARGLQIPAQFLHVRFSRSGGPGGQNVNKVSSKVDLRLDLEGAGAILGEARLLRIRTALATRLDGEGNLQVVNSEHRSQAQNLEGALARMEALLREALRVRRVRRPTKPSRGSRKRRLQEKKQRGQVKHLRQRPGAED